MSNDRRLKDRVAVITGAAQGIGFGIAERLAAEGAIAILADIKAKRRVPPQSAWLTRAMLPRPCPSTSATMPPWRNWPPLSDRKYGRCEILVNNAAIGADTHIETMTMEEYHRDRRHQPGWRGAHGHGLRAPASRRPATDAGSSMSHRSRACAAGPTSLPTPPPRAPS